MTDKQILELAAKAAGIKLVFDPHGLPRNCTDMEPAMNIFAAKLWNPLEDDGDALRLAVKLGIQIVHYSVTSKGLDRVNAGRNGSPILYGDDPYAATRRAITLAAAEIGKAMP
jgi:hypothetical protein